MNRPDLIRSWASDVMHLFAPDYVWHPRAQVWQKEGDDEALVTEMFGGTFDQQMAVVNGLGITGPVAERLAAGFDAELGRAALSLLRSAVQPVMAEAGRGLAGAISAPACSAGPRCHSTGAFGLSVGIKASPAADVRDGGCTAQ
jgi:hypothetical protein